jgi:hypothetical protein
MATKKKKADQTPEFVAIPEGAWNNLVELKTAAQSIWSDVQEKQATLQEEYSKFQAADREFTSYLKGISDFAGIELSAYKIEDRRFVALTEEELAAQAQAQAQSDDAVILDEEVIEAADEAVVETVVEDAA